MRALDPSWNDDITETGVRGRPDESGVVRAIRPRPSGVDVITETGVGNDSATAAEEVDSTTELAAAASSPTPGSSTISTPLGLGFMIPTTEGVDSASLGWRATWSR